MAHAVTWAIKLYDDRRWTPARQVGMVLAGTFDGLVQLGENGEFELQAPLSGTTVKDRDDQTVRSIMVLDGSDMLFAGLVREAAKHGDKDGVTVGWRGHEAYGALIERSAYPEVFGDGDWSGRAWRYNGRASAVAAAAVSEQYGLEADPARQGKVRALDDGAGKPGVRTAAPTDRLDDFVARMADGTPTGLVCSTSVNDAGEIVFRFGAPRNLDIRFSNDQLIEWNTKVVHPTVTHVAGIGPVRADGTRRVRVRSTGKRGADRIEKVVETSGELDEQVEEIDKALAAGAEQVHVSAVLTPTAAAKHHYPRDYRIGDIVTVEIGGVPFSVPITGVRLTRDQNGAETVTPLLGNGPPNLTWRLFMRMRELERYQRRHAV